MRLNIKNPDTNLIMYEKKSNTTSIVIAVISVLLILGGVYLINQSIGKANNDNKPVETKTTNLTSETSSPSDSTADEKVESSTSSDTDTTTTTTTSTQVQPSEENVTADNSKDPNTVTPTTDPATTPETKTTKETTLNENESIIKVVKVTPGANSTRYDIEIVETGFKDGQRLKAGASTFVNLSGITLAEGKTYQISSVTEKDGKISMSSLKATEVVQ